MNFKIGFSKLHFEMLSSPSKFSLWRVTGLFVHVPMILLIIFLVKADVSLRIYEEIPFVGIAQAVKMMKMK